MKAVGSRKKKWKKTAQDVQDLTRNAFLMLLEAQKPA